MAQVVDAGDNAFAAMAYGRPSEKTFGFLDQSISHFTNSLADYAQNFYSTCRSVYNRIDNSEAMRLVKAAYGAIDTYAMHDVIQRLDNIHQMQNAPNVMIPWLMANPVVRELYQERGCAGYGEMYENMYGASIGMEHVEYRAATHGLWREVDGEMVCDIYPDISCNPKLQLTIDEQLDITNAWLDMNEYIERGGVDPTSRFNAKL